MNLLRTNKKRHEGGREKRWDAVGRVGVDVVSGYDRDILYKCMELSKNKKYNLKIKLVFKK